MDPYSANRNARLIYEERLRETEIERHHQCVVAQRAIPNPLPQVKSRMMAVLASIRSRRSTRRESQRA